MDLNSILAGSKKKNGSSFGTTSESALQSPQPSQTFTSANDNSSFLAKKGDSSYVELTNACYNYDENKQTVEFTIGRLDNSSSEMTGDIRIYCWLSEERYTFDGGWGNDNKCCIGEYFLGHLELGYGFPDVKCTFKIPDGIFPLNCRWHFVFTINEYHEDDKWYIIDYRNCECHLSDNDFDAIVRILECKLGVNSADIKYDSNLEEDLYCDELDRVELCMEFEKEFDIVIEESDWDQVVTVGDIIDLIVDIL